MENDGAGGWGGVVDSVGWEEPRQRVVERASGQWSVTLLVTERSSDLVQQPLPCGPLSSRAVSDRVAHAAGWARRLDGHQPQMLRWT